CRNRKMTDLPVETALLLIAAAARAFSSQGKDKPPRPKAPILRNSRRDWPRRWSEKDSMAGPPMAGNCDRCGRREFLNVQANAIISHAVLGCQWKTEDFSQLTGKRETPSPLANDDFTWTPELHLNESGKPGTSRLGQRVVHA